MNVQEEIRNATTIIDNSYKTNNRLLSKEASIEIFNDIMDEAIERNPEYFRSDNYDRIIYELFSLENVHVCRLPCDHYFNKDGEWVVELPTYTYRSLNESEVINSVKSYLEQGAVVYLYMFYTMRQEVVGLGEVETYWWRMIRKKDE